MESQGERTEYGNGRRLIDISAFSNFRINNTLLSHKEIRKYIWCARGTLLYGSDNWISTKSQASRIQVAELRFLKHVAGYALQDYIKSIGCMAGTKCYEYI